MEDVYALFLANKYNIPYFGFDNEQSLKLYKEFSSIQKGIENEENTLIKKLPIDIDKSRMDLVAEVSNKIENKNQQQKHQQFVVMNKLLEQRENQQIEELKKYYIGGRFNKIFVIGSSSLFRMKEKLLKIFQQDDEEYI